MVFKSLTELRNARNLALQATDYLMLPDAKFNKTMKDLLLAYRQELRDITSIAERDGLENVTLPAKPNFHTPAPEGEIPNDIQF